MDALPPVPGAEAVEDPDQGTVDDAAVVPAPPPNPYDLEGLDWSAVDGLFAAFPTASQIDFIEFTLDTQDWFRVGQRLALAASQAEVPVLWRQDWRAAPQYERMKRLEAPSGLAGLEGPWPADDWPAKDEPLWPAHEAVGASAAPFRVTDLKLVREGGRVFLETRLTRPAELTVDWGRSLPLKRRSVSAAGDGVLHRIPLEDLPQGGLFLLRLKGVSPKYGVCLLRTRWMRTPR
jgi:hypothetical protein